MLHATTSMLHCISALSNLQRAGFEMCKYLSFRIFIKSETSLILWIHLGTEIGVKSDLVKSDADLKMSLFRHRPKDDVNCKTASKGSKITARFSLEAPLKGKTLLFYLEP